MIIIEQISVIVIVLIVYIKYMMQDPHSWLCFDSQV